MRTTKEATTAWVAPLPPHPMPRPNPYRALPSGTLRAPHSSCVARASSTICAWDLREALAFLLIILYFPWPLCRNLYHLEWLSLGIKKVDGDLGTLDHWIEHKSSQWHLLRRMNAIRCMCAHIHGYTYFLGCAYVHIFTRTRTRIPP